jgi:hypothetical protein
MPFVHFAGIWSGASFVSSVMIFLVIGAPTHAREDKRKAEGIRDEQDRFKPRIGIIPASQSDEQH